MTKFLPKIKKNFVGVHFGPLFSKFGQKQIFLERMALSVFKYSNYLTLRQKSEKTNKSFPSKMSNCWMDRQTTLIL